MTKETNLFVEIENKSISKIRNRWNEIDSMAGVGLDPDMSKIPKEIFDEVGSNDKSEIVTLFNKKIIDATAPYVVDFKINSNFYQDDKVRKALRNTFNYIKSEHPNILRVYDCKVADVCNTAEHLAQEIFGDIDADAVILNPYLGVDAIEPFTRWKDKLVILCINTSNPSADSIQNVKLENGMPLWRFILNKSLTEWNGNKNIIPVLSATHIENLKNIRSEIGQIPILLAGVGSQGGSLKDSVPYCLDNQGYGLMISSSRGILYPERKPGESFTEASKRSILNLKNEINNSKK